MVDLVTVYSDCAYRACRAEILACSAADTLLFFDGRNPDGLAVFADLLDELDGSYRAVTGAVAALFDFTVVDEAEPGLDSGRTDLLLCLLLGSDFQDGSGGADFRALDALGAAVTTLEGHLRLHQVHQVFGRPEYIVGAD